MKNFYLVATLLFVPGAALAQNAVTHCPSLPAASGLQWQEKSGAGFIACKAIASDGHQSLNLMLTSRDPDLRLSRSQRAEEGRFSGKELRWYIPEVAGRDASQIASRRRITVIELGNDQYAQVWIDATSPEELGKLQALAEKLDVSAGAAYLASSGN